jgi:hypothetical protein
MSEELKQVVDEINDQMKRFHRMLEERGKEIEVSGGDPEVAMKLVKGADAMKDSANIYLSWAKHYVALAEGGASEADEGEEDSAGFQF